MRNQKQYKMENGNPGKKFMQVLDIKVWNQLRSLSKERGVTVQEYLRVLVIPEHLQKVLPKIKKKSKWSKRVKKGWIKRRANKERKETIPAQIPIEQNTSVLPSQ